ncbi:MAG: TVP38/TMEM64 family protein, partial [Lachnospiraceae bacterium]|nr:TVP38/TMEM64 family protein [Lachnospiraceae bacterium]
RSFREAGFHRREEKLTWKQILVLAAVAISVCVIFYICWWFVEPMVRMAREPGQFRAYIDEKGAEGIFMFLLASFLQVIAAFIPGGPLEIAAGYTFGVLKGSLLCDIGMSAGSLAVFLLVKRFGMNLVGIFFPRDKIDSMKFLKTTRRGRLVFFILFLIPGTPKDFLTYFVGLTDMPVTLWFLITFVGRFPSILLSAMSGGALESRNYLAAVIILILLVVVCAAGAMWYRQYLGKKNLETSEEEIRSAGRKERENADSDAHQGGQ